MLTRMRVYALLKKAWEINESNSRYKIGVDYSKVCGEHHCNIHVIDETAPYNDKDSISKRVLVCETVDMKDGYGHISFDRAMEIMEKYREVNDESAGTV